MCQRPCANPDPAKCWWTGHLPRRTPDTSPRSTSQDHLWLKGDGGDVSVGPFQPPLESGKREASWDGCQPHQNTAPTMAPQADPRQCPCLAKVRKQQIKMHTGPPTPTHTHKLTHSHTYTHITIHSLNYETRLKGKGLFSCHLLHLVSGFGKSCSFSPLRFSSPLST